MSTTLATTDDAPLARRSQVDGNILEQVLARGDLSKLTPEERTQWYIARCEAAGLDHRTQPFEYITLQGKLTLYARKSATDQLAGIHQISLDIFGKHVDEQGIYVVECRAKFPSGRTVEDMGAVFVQGLKGQDLGNAYLKCVTKAKRRTILSACGLGMLDETEVEDLSREAYEPKPDPPQNNSGHGRGQYASPEQIREYKEALEAYITTRNQRWLDHWTLSNGEIPQGVRDIVNIFQVDNHLLKWAVETKRLDQTIVPESAKMRQLAAYVAIVYHRSSEDRTALKRELVAYVDQQAARLTDVIIRENPDLFPVDSEDDNAPKPGSDG
jgi:hypothetical protein